MIRIFHLILFVVSMFIAHNARADAYSIFRYDNGDDYIRQRLRRITNAAGKIGFADSWKTQARMTPEVKLI